MSVFAAAGCPAGASLVVAKNVFSRLQKFSLFFLAGTVLSTAPALILTSL